MRIYVAGLYTRNRLGEMANFLEALENMRTGILAAIRLVKMGHAPFCPWLDFQFGLLADGLTSEDYYRCSAEWLRVSDAALFLSGWEVGRGTVEEHRIAKEMNIPIFYSIWEIPIESP